MPGEKTGGRDCGLCDVTIRRTGRYQCCNVTREDGAGRKSGRPADVRLRRGQALVRRFQEPAQALGPQDAAGSSRRALQRSTLSRPLAGGKKPRWRRPEPVRLGCSCFY